MAFMSRKLWNVPTVPYRMQKKKGFPNSVSLWVSANLPYHKMSQADLVVGKGLHSSEGSAKIRPAIEELMQKLVLVLLRSSCPD